MDADGRRLRSSTGASGSVDGTIVQMPLVVAADGSVCLEGAMERRKGVRR